MMLMKQQQIHAVKRLPASAQTLIERYRSLHIQGMTATCPYHINCGTTFARHRALVGKGRPEEIEAAAEHYFAKYHMSAQGDPEQLRRYLMACGLGIDCSGFAAWVLNCVTQETLGKPIWQCLTFPGLKRRTVSKLRPFENISANLLTSNRNTYKVDDLGQIRPGDMIRLIHGGHVMVVSEVGKGKGDQVVYFDYTQSTVSYVAKNGIDTGRVTVTQSDGYLLDQAWADEAIYRALQESGDEARIVRLKALTL